MNHLPGCKDALTRIADCDCLERQLKSKIAKQRDEISRLQNQVRTLRTEKAVMARELTMIRLANR